MKNGKMFILARQGEKPAEQLSRNSKVRSGVLCESETDFLESMLKDSWTSVFARRDGASADRDIQAW